MLWGKELGERGSIAVRSDRDRGHTRRGERRWHACEVSFATGTKGSRDEGKSRCRQGISRISSSQTACVRRALAIPEPVNGTGAVRIEMDRTLCDEIGRP